MSATQLTATASLFVQYRPPGMGESQTNWYFAVSVANNVVYHSCKVVIKCIPFGSESIVASFLVHFLSMTGLSLVTIIIMQGLMVVKLKAMERLDARTYVIYKIQRVIVFALCATVGLVFLSARYRAEAPEEQHLWYDSVFLVMIALFFFAFLLSTSFGARACIVFYEAWQATSNELREGGASFQAKILSLRKSLILKKLTLRE
jgi:hypothetical protein